MADLGIFSKMNCDDNVIKILTELKASGKNDVQIIEVLGAYESEGFVDSTTEKDKIKLTLTEKGIKKLFPNQTTDVKVSSRRKKS